jgi:hypothetical protein
MTSSRFGPELGTTDAGVGGLQRELGRFCDALIAGDDKEVAGGCGAARRPPAPQGVELRAPLRVRRRAGRVGSVPNRDARDLVTPMRSVDDARRDESVLGRTRVSE